MPAPLEVRCESFPVLSETFVVNEVRALARLGHDVVVHAHQRGDGEAVPDVAVTYREDETTAQRIAAVLRLALRHPLGVARDLLARGRWRREEPVMPLRVLAPALLRARGRHVHVHFAKASALDALRGRRIAGAPFSLTAHAYDIYAAPANLREKLRAASIVTTGCEYTARDLRAIAPDARVEVVVMGVDPERFRRSVPHGDRRVVLAVGRLVEKKGFGVLVAAAADPALRGLLDEVRIVGDGPLRGALEAQARELGAAVRLLGGRSPEEVRAELEQAAGLAMPCVIAADGDRDSMPVVVKEALAMEVPVVASREVGLPEIVLPAFGRLVAPGDPVALARGLAEILTLDAEGRAAMGRAGREHVAAHADLVTETGRLSALLGEPQRDMGAFWDERAREDALFFVDDRIAYRDADVDAFFAAGAEAVAAFERQLGFRAEGSHLVEIGCGVGRLTRVLAARAGELHALDVSGEMLARAREHNPQLGNVEWLHGDGVSLAGVPDGWADGVFSHVVFQHIPDPAITLGYVREMGRVLRPGGWAAFQISDDPGAHVDRTPLRDRVRGLLRRGPRGRTHPAWIGSAVSLDALRETAAEAGMDVEQTAAEGTQYCLVLLRRR